MVFGEEGVAVSQVTFIIFYCYYNRLYIIPSPASGPGNYNLAPSLAPSCPYCLLHAPEPRDRKHCKVPGMFHAARCWGIL
jgi:hypothetical protein